MNGLLHPFWETRTLPGGPSLSMDEEKLERHEGVLRRLTRDGFGIIEDNRSHDWFAFTFDKIVGYRGQDAQELGLSVGANIAFSVPVGSQVVASVEV